MQTSITVQYEKALARAQAEHLYVKGPFKTSYGFAFHVSHPEDANGHYTVRFTTKSEPLTCNCQAGQRGVYCKHRALVHHFLVLLIGRGVQLRFVKLPEPRSPIESLVPDYTAFADNVARQAAQVPTWMLK